jgi:hypothetical protein
MCSAVCALVDAADESRGRAPLGPVAAAPAVAAVLGVFARAAPAGSRRGRKSPGITTVVATVDSLRHLQARLEGLALAGAPATGTGSSGSCAGAARAAHTDASNGAGESVRGGGPQQQTPAADSDLWRVRQGGGGGDGHEAQALRRLQGAAGHALLQRECSLGGPSGAGAAPHCDAFSWG